MPNDGVTVIGLESLTTKLKKIPPGLFSRSLMAKIGAYVVAAIKLRTKDGVDVNEKRFKPYSAGHRKRRAAIGLPTGNVDLYFSGLMMSSLTHEVVDSKQVRAFFMNTADEQGVSSPSKAFFNDQTRNFFGVSKKDIKGIESVVQKRLDELLSY
jgi:hypothetical protein